MSVVRPRSVHQIWAAMTAPGSPRRQSLTRNLLVPGWIILFGCVLMSVQPIGVLGCLLLCAGGLVAVPALALFAGTARV